MQVTNILKSATAVALIGLALAACQKEEGTFEEAGKSLDQAVESVKDAADKDGAMEQAGEKLDKAVEDMKKSD